MIYIGIILTICYLIVLVWLSNGMLKQQFKIDETFHPDLSIIISAYNEESSIAYLLKALISQNYSSKYEIIIANDRSTDSTEEIISSYVKKYNYIHLINIKKTPIGWGHKKWALNECIDKAQYDIILQTDADCRPKKNWIKSMVANFADPNVIFVSGPAPMENPSNKLSEYYKLDSLAQDALSAAGISRNTPFSCTGRNIGFLKSSFLDINGYDGIQNYQSGDDDLLLQKFSTLLKGKINFSFNQDSVVISDPPSSIREFFNQRIRYASKGIDYYKLNTTTIEFKILLPFLYIINIISLFGIIFFIQKTQSIYLLPIFLKIIADYWICTIFFNQINEEFSILDFIVLSLIHPVYVVSLGIISPFINFNWKNNV